MSTRTTLTLDSDVAKQIERRRRSGGRSLKAEINHLLRLGLASDEGSSTEPRERYRVKPMALGPLRFPIDDVELALDFAEGEDRH